MLILRSVWRQQTTNWGFLVLNFVSDVISIVHGYLKDLLEIVCHSTRAAQGLLEVLFEHLFKRYEYAMDQARLHLRIERSGMLLTSNH